MIKRISELDTVYDGDLFINEENLRNIETLWNDFIKDKDPGDYFNGDVYCVTDVDDSVPLIKIAKTKYSSIVYAQKTNNMIARSLFSAGYIKTSDNYICIILNKIDRLNCIGGMASNDDFINDKYDYNKCFIREFKEELGIDLNNNKDFLMNLKYLKYPSASEINEAYYPVGTLFEVTTKYTSKELVDIFKNSEHETEVKELKFYNENNFKEVYSYDKKTGYLDELFNLLFEK